jgi:hypothetical protein
MMGVVNRVLPALLLVAGCDLDPMTQGDGPGASASASAGETDGSGSDGAGGSTGGMTGQTDDVIDLLAWTVDTSDADPFGPAPADAACDAGFGEEGGLFEVDTGLCTWGTFVQSSLAPMAAGDELEFVLVHDALYAEEAGVTAFLGVAVGDAVAWSEEIPIPAEPNYLRPTFAAPADAPVGTEIRFHVHNHGLNSYRVVALTVTR